MDILGWLEVNALLLHSSRRLNARTMVGDVRVHEHFYAWKVHGIVTVFVERKMKR